MSTRRAELRKTASFTLLAALALTGCSDDGSTSGAGGGSGASTSSQGGASTSSSESAGGGGSSTVTGTTTATTSAGGGTAGDPNEDGPYAYDTVNAMVTVASTTHTFSVRAFVPSTGPTAGPYPFVVVAHGFQLPATQYEGYAKRLATFGFVAVTPEYPASAFSPSHKDNALDLIGVIDWAESATELGGKADTSNTGLTGHSLGGKVSFLAATMDSRVKAALGIDPVDSAQGCNATECPDVSALMPSLAIPTGFVGETTDASGGFMPCAPAADNFETFYAGAQSPSFAVTVNGANHMSFLDDVASCGFTCSFCQMASASNASVNDLGKAYVAAFFEKTLRGDASFDTYLTGAEATTRYVTPGLATIESK